MLTTYSVRFLLNVCSFVSFVSKLAEKTLKMLFKESADNVDTLVQQNALWSSGLDTQIIKSSSLARYITCSKPSYSNDDVCSSGHLAVFILVVPLLLRPSLKHARPLSLPHGECIIWKAMLNAIYERQSKSSRNSLVHHKFVPPGHFYVQVFHGTWRNKWQAGTVVSGSR
jgi:hypothetical protein